MDPDSRARHISRRTAGLDDAGHETGAIEQGRAVGGLRPCDLRRDQGSAGLRAAPDERALADDELAAGRVAGNRDARAHGRPCGADPNTCAPDGSLGEPDRGEVGGRLLDAARGEGRPVLRDDAASVDGHDSGAGAAPGSGGSTSRWSFRSGSRCPGRAGGPCTCTCAPGRCRFVRPACSLTSRRTVPPDARRPPRGARRRLAATKRQGERTRAENEPVTPPLLLRIRLIRG